MPVPSSTPPSPATAIQIDFGDENEMVSIPQ